MPSQPRPITPDLDTLTRLFYAAPADLGGFDEVTADEMPADYRRLLAHEQHMTVTVEAFHGGPVDVVVLEKRLTPTHYARKILLARQSDGRVVQFGIMRVNLACLSPEVKEQILAEGTPLGRVLIEHGLLTNVQLFSLWRVAPGPDLARLFDLKAAETTYGRTALIELDGAPAVELIEIITPLPAEPAGAARAP